MKSWKMIVPFLLKGGVTYIRPIFSVAGFLNLVASNSLSLAKMQGTEGQHSGHDSNHLRIESLIRVYSVGRLVTNDFVGTYQMEES